MDEGGSVDGPESLIEVEVGEWELLLARAHDDRNGTPPLPLLVMLLVFIDISAGDCEVWTTNDRSLMRTPATSDMARSYSVKYMHRCSRI